MLCQYMGCTCIQICLHIALHRRASARCQVQQRGHAGRAPQLDQPPDHAVELRPDVHAYEHRKRENHQVDHVVAAPLPQRAVHAPQAARQRRPRLLQRLLQPLRRRLGQLVLLADGLRQLRAALAPPVKPPLVKRAAGALWRQRYDTSHALPRRTARLLTERRTLRKDDWRSSSGQQ